MEAAKQTNESYILKALESDQLLTVIEFVKAVGYPIDNFMIDKFWASIEENKLIYASDELIRWMGYSGAEAKHRKAHFMKLLIQNEFYYYTFAQYEQFLKGARSSIGDRGLYPPLPSGTGSTSTKHLLLTPKCLKLMMMRTSTARGDQVREYYFALEDLFKTYVRYQSEYKTKEIQLALEKTRLSCAEQSAKAEKDLQEILEKNPKPRIKS